MKSSFVELNARERANALLDSGRELIDPFDQIIAPSLPTQGIVPESDDGIAVSRGTINGRQTVVVAMEGKFQGSSIGEVSGAKIATALERVLEGNKKGNEVFPVIVLDTGDVRLQEANYGLLSISKIGSVIIALKQHVPVIDLVPGRVGLFGNVSVTSALVSYLVAARRARAGSDGPRVTEQEAGVREFDSSDKDLVWDALGSRQRVESKVINELVTDSVEVIEATVIATMDEQRGTHRSKGSAFYLSLLDSLDLSEPMAIDDYNEAIASHQAKSIDLPGIAEGDKPAAANVGYDWFAALTGMKNPTPSISTVYYGKSSKLVEEAIVTSVVPDLKSPMYRVRSGEVGLVEGFHMGQILDHVYEEDKDKKVKRPIIIVIDVPSQTYSYNEELIGIHITLASSAAAYTKLRRAGHPVTGLIAGGAISGTFLTHGLQSSRLVALNNREITVQTMSKENAVRATKRSVAEIETAAKKVPAIAYDIGNYTELGAIYHFLEDIADQTASEQNISKIIEAISEAIQDVHNTNGTMLTNRYTNETARTLGHIETDKVRAKVDEEWDT